MSKRLQVVMDDAEYHEIQEAAASRRLTASAWVRQVLRAAREHAAREHGAGASGTSGTLAADRAAPTTASAAVPGLEYDDRALVEAVMLRHGFSSAQDAIRYALRRAAEPPMLREEMLELRGTGWAGDLEGMR